MLEQTLTINLPSGVQDVEEARLRVDHRSLLVRVLDRWVVVVDEVVLRDFFLKEKHSVCGVPGHTAVCCLSLMM